MYSLLFLVHVLLCAVAAENSDPETVYGFNHVNFDWPSDMVKAQYKKNGWFTPNHLAIAGLKVWAGRVFTTVPRWINGIPATLTEIVMKQGEPVVRPWPSWEMNSLNSSDCEAIIYAQSMEIDRDGIMWVIDSGAYNAGDSVQPSQYKPAFPCSPKVVLISVETGEVIKSLTLKPPAVKPHLSFLNDIVVDSGRWRAYITDSSLDNKGGIIMADLITGKASRFDNHPSLGPFSGVLPWNGIKDPSKGTVDGIALSPNGTYIYYCSVPSLALYRIPADNFETIPVPANGVVKIGNKPSWTDGMVATTTGLFYGAQGMDAIYRLQIPRTGVPQIDNQTQKLVAENNHTMQWIDTFSVDTEGFLWWVSNRLPFFFGGALNLTQPNTEANYNFRVMKTYIGELSYIWGGLV